jgi:hypothetical protein
MAQLELGFLKYDIVKILGTCPVQIMAVLWDPIENNGVPPETWRFLYNFEVYHHRSIPSELLVTSASMTAAVTAGTALTETTGNMYTNPKVIPTPANISVAAGVAAANHALASGANSVAAGASVPNNEGGGSVGLDAIYHPPSEHESVLSMANPLNINGEQGDPHPPHHQSSPSVPGGGAAVVVGVKSSSSPPVQKRKGWLGRMTSSSSSSAYNNNHHN